jgi:hypothetical protein
MSPRRRAGTSRARNGAGEPGLTGHLESEDLNTNSAEIARLWEETYTELIDLERKVLARVQTLLPGLSTAARREAELTNVPMMVQHLQTFIYRRAWWRRRREELDGD